MSTSHPAVSIDDSFGAGYLGAMVTAVLYGITSLQTYLFFVYYPKDSRSNKILVSTIWVLDTIHVILVTICIYHYLVTNYSNPPALAYSHWSLNISVIFNILLAVLVQGFFTKQIYVVCEHKWKKWLAGGILFVVVLHFIFGIETVVFLYLNRRFTDFQQPRITLIAATPFAITAVLSDILIAVTLCVILRGSRTGFSGTNALVSKLIIYAINRCLLTATVAIIEVIIFSASPHSLWFLAIDFVIGKLYANSLLASLNSRRALRGSSTYNSHSESSGSRARSTHIGFGSISNSQKDTSTTEAGTDVDTRGHVIHLQSRSRNPDGAKTFTSSSGGEQTSGYDVDSASEIERSKMDSLA